MNEYVDSPPTEPGWYWYKEEGPPTVVELYVHNAYPKLRARSHGRNAMVTNMFGKWWPERIEVPEGSSSD